MYFNGLQKIVVSLFTLSICQVAYAETEEDGRYWFSFGVQSQIKETPWKWMIDVRPRWREEGREFDQVLIAPMVTYQLSPKVGLGLGIDHVINHPSGKPALEENRLTSQFSYQFDDIGALKLSARTRFEIRHRENASETAYRLRQMLRASYPLNAQFSVIAFDEYFQHLNDTDWNIHRGTDQNRVFIGLGWKPNAHWNTEVGYMNQFINTRTIDRENHIVSTSVRYTF